MGVGILRRSRPALKVGVIPASFFHPIDTSNRLHTHRPLADLGVVEVSRQSPRIYLLTNLISNPERHHTPNSLSAFRRFDECWDHRGHLHWPRRSCTLISTTQRKHSFRTLTMDATLEEMRTSSLSRIGWLCKMLLHKWLCCNL